ncbi:hypothetical protein DUNSADRAFT_8328 [Dunaliella salina]|uniref:Uncharacterized protein n=1 Tax=Dunaliella salina TaxID=3046 RepID=A0ABQ7H5X8_DUNSA|nr:hypothetical protein DUNSADRAFT_8328 [Dunaliella salina]|eukprot:KAF5842265.1 hypothetical protein DUNSADRAFT_8328 [Dunaliella salina]
MDFWGTCCARRCATSASARSEHAQDKHKTAAVVFYEGTCLCAQMRYQRQCTHQTGAEQAEVSGSDVLWCTCLCAQMRCQRHCMQQTGAERAEDSGSNFMVHVFVRADALPAPVHNKQAQNKQETAAVMSYGALVCARRCTTSANVFLHAQMRCQRQCTHQTGAEQAEDSGSDVLWYTCLCAQMRCQRQCMQQTGAEQAEDSNSDLLWCTCLRAQMRCQSQCAQQAGAEQAEDSGSDIHYQRQCAQQAGAGQAEGSGSLEGSLAPIPNSLWGSMGEGVGAADNSGRGTNGSSGIGSGLGMPAWNMGMDGSKLPEDYVMRTAAMSEGGLSMSLSPGTLF